MLRAAQLRAAAGQVQCGRCFNSFDARPALERVAVEAPQTAEIPAPASPASDPDRGQRPGVAEAAFSIDADPAPAHKPAWPEPDEAAAESPEALSWEDFTDEGAEGFGSLARLRDRLATEWMWWLGTAALALLLIVQILRGQGVSYAERHPDALFASVLCGLARCELPPRRDPAAIRLRARDVREHPRYRKALLINANLENGADFAQPYPLVGITLANNRNQILGGRVFHPAEYLDAAVDTATGMRPGMPVVLQLEVAVNSAEVSNFEFNFY